MREFKRINAEATAAACLAAFLRSGKTQTQLAREAGLNQGRISRFFKGEFTRLSPRMERICELLVVMPVYSVQKVELKKHPRIVDALQELLDGRKGRERDVLQLLTAAMRLGKQ